MIILGWIIVICVAILAAAGIGIAIGYWVVRHHILNLKIKALTSFIYRL